LEDLVCPDSVESGYWISCHGDDAVAFELHRCEHAESAVPSLPVMPDLEVVEDRVREVHTGLPSRPVEQFDPHAGPERL
jgi:hypothetical protein